MLKTTFAVSTNSSNLTQLTAAKQLAEVWQADFLEDVNAKYAYDCVLVLTEKGWGLWQPTEKKLFYIDFLQSSFFHRVQQANSKIEMVAKAMGLRPGAKPKILDATVGLGRDSFILAKCGYQVTALERSPIVFILLQDALKRASQNPLAQVIAQRISVIYANAVTFLQESKERFDVIYMDPMFPKRVKSAAVKKSAQILQAIVGEDEDIDELFQRSVACARYRVVVKRPRLSSPIIQTIRPHYVLEGKSSRFDIYLTKHGCHASSD